MADLDDLKSVNDTYSHLAGDDVLRFVAGLARESCRRADVVGRFGGDEFLFILPSTQVDEATTFAERFRVRLADGAVPIRTASGLTVTISVGVAQWEGDTMEGPSCLVKKADEAMYQAKSSGRNRTVVSPDGSVRAA
jgi:diguanylate cyclase (GGDEF)-like protein